MSDFDHKSKRKEKRNEFEKRTQTMYESAHIEHKLNGTRNTFET